MFLVFVMAAGKQTGMEIGARIHIIVLLLQTWPHCSRDELLKHLARRAGKDIA